jgi:hypothetical protein
MRLEVIDDGKICMVVKRIPGVVKEQSLKLRHSLRYPTFMHH